MEEGYQEWQREEARAAFEKDSAPKTARERLPKRI
jgi:hypothetical protein